MPPRPAAWKSQTACRPASARSSGSFRVTAVDQLASQDDPSPSLQPHYTAFIATTGRSAPVPRISTSPSRISRLGLSLPPATAGHNRSTGRPRARDDRFPRSTPEPGPSSRHLHAGHHLASRQAPARLNPGPGRLPGFDVVYRSFRHVLSGSLTLAFLAHT